MKKIVIAILLANVLAGCAVVSEYRAEVRSKVEEPVFLSEIDRFTGEKKIHWIKNYYDGDGYATNQKIDKGFFITIPKNAKDGTFFIATSKAFREHEWLRCHTINWLADGQMLKPISVKHESDIKKKPYVHVYETVFSAFTERDFNKIANSKIVEFKICNDEYSFTDEERNALQKVYNAVHE